MGICGSKGKTTDAQPAAKTEYQVSAADAVPVTATPKTVTSTPVGTAAAPPVQQVVHAQPPQRVVHHTQPPPQQIVYQTAPPPQVVYVERPVAYTPMPSPGGAFIRGAIVGSALRGSRMSRRRRC